MGGTYKALLDAMGRKHCEHVGLCALARRVVAQEVGWERHAQRGQRPTAEGGGERTAALVGDLVALEVQGPERGQHASGGRGQQSGQALVGDLVLVEVERPELGQLAQSRGQGGQPCASNGVEVSGS